MKKDNNERLRSKQPPLGVKTELQNAYELQYTTDTNSYWRDIGGKGKAENIIAICKGKSFGKVLEVGSGDGSLLHWLEKFNFTQQIEVRKAYRDSRKKDHSSFYHRVFLSKEWFKFLCWDILPGLKQIRPQTYTIMCTKTDLSLKIF